MKTLIEIGKKAISPSAYSMRVNDCPKQYQLRRVLKVPELPAVYLAGGDTLHAVTAAIDLLVEYGATEEEAINIAWRAADTVGLSAAFEDWVSDGDPE